MDTQEMSCVLFSFPADLRVGDELLLRDGRVLPVQGWRRSPFRASVYNFDVEGLQCYAVGQYGVLVHNNNGAEPPATAPKSGETSATARGRQAHKEYSPGSGYDKEVTLPSGKRADAVDWGNRDVRELKPDNPRAIKRGEKQVERYRKELEEMTGEKWTSGVDTYKP